VPEGVKRMPEFSHEGAILHYEIEGSGTPVICINGFGAHSNDIFSSRFREVMKEQFQCLSIDNRGAGQTRITAPHTPVTVEMMADDIAALIDHLGLGKAHIIGISMGGCIAMALSLRHPEKVKSQIIAVSICRYAPL
jgi:3-oxoadipate enol-lactonase